MAEVIFNKDLGSDVISEFGTGTYLQVKKFKFSVNVSLDDDIVEEIGDKLLILQNIADESLTAYNTLKDAIVTTCRRVDVAMAEMTPANRKREAKGLKIMIQNAVKTQQSVIARIPSEIWDEFVKTESEYKKYKVKQALTLSFTALSAVGGVAGSVAASSVGAGVVGFVQVARDVASIADQIRSLKQTADQTCTQLKGNLATLKQAVATDTQNALKKAQVIHDHNDFLEILKEGLTKALKKEADAEAKGEAHVMAEENTNKFKVVFRTIFQAFRSKGTKKPSAIIKARIKEVEKR